MDEFLKYVHINFEESSCNWIDEFSEDFNVLLQNIKNKVLQEKTFLDCYNEVYVALLKCGKYISNKHYTIVCNDFKEFIKIYPEVIYYDSQQENKLYDQVIKSFDYKKILKKSREKESEEEKDYYYEIISNNEINKESFEEMIKTCKITTEICKEYFTNVSYQYANTKELKILEIKLKQLNKGIGIEIYNFENKKINEEIYWIYCNYINNMNIISEVNFRMICYYLYMFLFQNKEIIVFDFTRKICIKDRIKIKIKEAILKKVNVKETIENCKIICTFMRKLGNICFIELE